MTRPGALALFVSLMAGSTSCDAGSRPPPATPPTPPPTATFLTDSGEVPIALRIARDPEQIQRGLMFVESLPPYEGMLFIFPAASVHSFWMKNTYIYLDMIFIDDEGRIVGIVENAEPLTLTSRTVGRASRYVIEVNGGFTKKHAIHTGDRVSFAGLPAPGP